MSSQPGQPTGGSNEPQKFNITKFIITLILLGAIVLFFLWQFGVFSSKTSLMTANELQKELVKNGYIKVDSSTGAVTLLDGKHVYYSDDIYSHTVAIYGQDAKDALKAGNKIGTISINTDIFKEKLMKDGSFWNIILHDGDKTGIGSATAPNKTNWFSIIIGLLPMLLWIFIMVWIFRRSSRAGGGMGEVFSGGKNQARKIHSTKKFSDVAGQEEVKEEVREVVDFLKKPAKYKAAGARVPKGIMLGGPPGTGKTLMAKAVAGEAGVPFFFISASNFVEMFAGLGAKRVREMFKESRKAAPAILFIDELDAIGRKRGSSLSGNDEREQTLNQILVEMDGMDENSGLLIIAATNRPDVLDPALMRPGRFDRQITIGLPDIKEREAIFKLHAKGKRISSDVEFANIAKRTPRFSGAQIENVINEAALLSVRESTEVITIDQIDEAIDRVNAGPAKKHRVITPEENRMVAYHEAGHAVTGLKVPDGDIVQKITIIPRGMAGGYTLRTPRKEKYNYSKSNFESMLICFLGGRAAEQVIYGVGEVSTGAHDDIEKATSIARAMVTQYGMSKLGPIAYERNQGSQFLGGQERVKEYSDALAERIDEAIRDIITIAEAKAIEIVKKNKKLLELIADELVDKETIVMEEIDYIHKNMKRLPKNFHKKPKKEKHKTLTSILDEVEKTSEVKTDKKTKSNKTDKK